MTKKNIVILLLSSIFICVMGFYFFNSKQIFNNEPKNQDISFRYEILDTSKYSIEYDDGVFQPNGVSYHSMKIKCTITNNSDTTISYLDRSCGEIVYSLNVVPSNYRVEKDLHCNASWYLLSNLKGKESFEFVTNITSKGDSINVGKIGICFVKTKTGFSSDTLRNNLSDDTLDKIIIGGVNSVNEENIVWSNSPPALCWA